MHFAASSRMPWRLVLPIRAELAYGPQVRHPAAERNEDVTTTSAGCVMSVAAAAATVEHTKFPSMVGLSDALYIVVCIFR